MGQPKLNYRGFPEGNGFFEELPDSTRDIVERLLLEAMEEHCNQELYGVEARAIECRSRDGFSPFSHNKGGVNVTGYTDLMYMQGSGYYPSAKKSSELINSIIDNSLQLATEQFFEENNELLTKNGFDSVSKVSHRDLLDSENKEVQALSEELSEFENEYLSGDENSVMFEIRAMYHGMD